MILWLPERVTRSTRDKAECQTGHGGPRRGSIGKWRPDRPGFKSQLCSVSWGYCDVVVCKLEVVKYKLLL